MASVPPSVTTPPCWPQQAVMDRVQPPHPSPLLHPSPTPHSPQVVVSRYPQLTVVTDRLLDIYCQLTGERHSESDHGSQQEASEEKSAAPLEGRALSLRWD